MTEQPLTDERAQMMRDQMMATVSSFMDEGFSPIQIGTMMAALSARILHKAGNAGSVDAVVNQLRKTAAATGHVGMQ